MALSQCAVSPLQLLELAVKAIHPILSLIHLTFIECLLYVDMTVPHLTDLPVVYNDDLQTDHQDIYSSCLYIYVACPGGDLILKEISL